MKKTAIAHWAGDLNTGHGDLTTQSLVLNQTQYSYKNHFASGTGSNPEELLAAAHAGCFTMSVSYAISQLGFLPGEMNTKGSVTVDPNTGSISQIDLELTANAIAGLSETDFIHHATLAKQNCLISKALAAVEIQLKVNYQDLLAS